jgi:hypothetical protein
MVGIVRSQRSGLRPEGCLVVKHKAAPFRVSDQGAYSAVPVTFNLNKPKS